jgi:hypothetical protein
MSPTEEKEYFERAAMSNKMIAHQPENPSEKRFFRWAIEEFESDISQRFNGIALVLEKAGFREEDNLSDNRYLVFDRAFWILTPISDINNLEELESKEDDCYEVALQMYAKLVNDKQLGKFKGYEPNSFQATMFQNLLGTAVGYRCQYRYKTPAPTELNPSDWNTDTTA